MLLLAAMLVLAVAGCDDEDCAVSARVADLIESMQVNDCGRLDDGDGDRAAWMPAQECVRTALVSQTPFKVFIHHDGIEGGTYAAYVGLRHDGRFDTYRFYEYTGEGTPTQSSRIQCHSLQMGNCADVFDDLCLSCAGATEDRVCHFPTD